MRFSRINALIILIFVILCTSCSKPLLRLPEPYRPASTVDAGRAELLFSDSKEILDNFENVDELDEAIRKLTDAASFQPDNYEIHWQASRALYLKNYCFDGPAYLNNALLGIAFAEQARQLDAERVEGHYYYLLNLGMYCDKVRGIKALELVKEMESLCLMIIDKDDTIDSGGVYRFLGLLYCMAPEWPTSIGDSEEGLNLLQKAVDMYPEYAGNYLSLAQGCHEEKMPEARDRTLERFFELLGESVTPLAKTMRREAERIAN